MLRIIDTEAYGLREGIAGITSVDVIDRETINPVDHLVHSDRPISP